jgi:hypothetical protein
MRPVVVAILGGLRRVGSLWPGFALIFCGLLRLNRQTCAFLAAAYVLEAFLVAATSFSALANVRFQYVWLATDTTLAAALVASLLAAAAGLVNPIKKKHRVAEAARCFPEGKEAS